MKHKHKQLELFNTMEYHRAKILIEKIPCRSWEENHLKPLKIKELKAIIKSFTGGPGSGTKQKLREKILAIAKVRGAIQGIETADINNALNRFTATELLQLTKSVGLAWKPSKRERLSSLVHWRNRCPEKKLCYNNNNL